MPKIKAPLPNPQPGPPLDFEEWLKRRMENFANNPPKFEASWYGPHNALLHHYFPYQRQFMVKPQPKLRPVYNPGLLGDPTISVSSREKLSYASTGHVVIPRKKGGKEKNVVIPDFTVVKASESITSDKPLLYVEVKPNADDEEWATGKNQLRNYMQHHVNALKTDIDGLLICGAEAEIYHQTYYVDKVVPAGKVGDRCSLKDRPVQDLLHRLATENW